MTEEYSIVCIYATFSLSIHYSLVFLVIAILTGMRWYFSVIDFISLRVSEVEHFFHIPFGHFLFSFWKSLFRSIAHF
jgi:hypothetical protein